MTDPTDERVAEAQAACKKAAGPIIKGPESQQTLLAEAAGKSIAVAFDLQTERNEARERLIKEKAAHKAVYERAAKAEGSDVSVWVAAHELGIELTETQAALQGLREWREGHLLEFKKLLARIRELDYDAFQIEVNAWADKAFPQATLHSRLAHMKAELGEIEDNPTDVMEWADGFLLFIQAASHESHKVSEILAAARSKLEINRGRDWASQTPMGLWNTFGRLARGEDRE